MTEQPAYSLGSDEQELARLDRQAAMFAAPTDMLLRAAGIGPGMRVLDLGTGLGHVAMQVAELVGPSGSVVGVDNAAEALEVARRRAGTNVSFVEGDVRTFRDGEPFDAIVMRLLLFHLPDAAAVLRHHADALRDGGLMVAIDYDIGRAGSEPPVATAEEALGWIDAGFRSAGANPRVGARLGPLLRGAGLDDVTALGVQGYFAPDDPAGPAMVASVVRALTPQLEAKGIVTAADIGLEDLEQRVAAALREADAVLLPPTLAGAWGRRGA